MIIMKNPARADAAPPIRIDGIPYPSTDWRTPTDLFRRCPHAMTTPLASLDICAEEIGFSALYAKDERGRMGLGSFKALGAAYVIARDAEAGLARGRTYVCASAGNHGLSVAAGAAAFGAKAVIFIAETVPEAFADRLRQLGAEVIRTGKTYEQSMQAASEFAEHADAALLSDSSWDGYTDRPYHVMEGYLILMREVHQQIGAKPTHIFLQAGVGGLAGASAAFARDAWGDEPTIIVVEPEAAPALAASIEASQPVTTEGPVSEMGRLDCKEPSLIALQGLSRDADFFATISEDEGRSGARWMEDNGLPSTPSGAAGLAALLASDVHRETLGLNASSRILTILSEGPEQ